MDKAWSDLVQQAFSVQRVSSGRINLLTINYFSLEILQIEKFYSETSGSRTLVI